MDAPDIEQLRTAARKLYDREVEAAQRKLASRLQMIDELANELRPSLPHQDEPAERVERRSTTTVRRVRKSPHTGKLTPTAAVRAAIEHLPGVFSMPQIAEWIERSHPEAKIQRPHLSSALHKLRQMKEIDQVKAPMGRDPAVYRKAGHGQLALPVSSNGQ